MLRIGGALLVRLSRTSGAGVSPAWSAAASGGGRGLLLGGMGAALAGKGAAGRIGGSTSMEVARAAMATRRTTSTLWPPPAPPNPPRPSPRSYTLPTPTPTCFGFLRPSSPLRVPPATNPPTCVSQLPRTRSHPVFVLVRGRVLGSVRQPRPGKPKPPTLPVVVTNGTDARSTRKNEG